MSKRDDNRGLELISGDAMLARKSLSTILLMAAFATSSCEDDVGDNRTPNSKYRKLSDQEIERILIGNNIKKYPIFWNHDNGISFFQGGKAVVYGYSDENASYLIKNRYFCLEMRMQNIKICSYLITNGKNVFEVSTDKIPSVYLLKICPLNQLHGSRRSCNFSVPHALSAAT